MSVRVSGLFDNVDVAEAAIRNLGNIHIHKRRISNTSNRTLGEQVQVLADYETDYAVNTLGYGGVGQSIEQGSVIPVAKSLLHQNYYTHNQEVQLDIWVDAIDASTAVNRFINSHGRNVHLY